MLFYFRNNYIHLVLLIEAAALVLSTFKKISRKEAIEMLSKATFEMYKSTCTTMHSCTLLLSTTKCK